ncbi:hypothetical protein ACX801_17470 [Arthrobacter bambusae]
MTIVSGLGLSVTEAIGRGQKSTPRGKNRADNSAERTLAGLHLGGDEMIAEIIVQVVAELIQGWFDWRPTARQRVLRALDLSKKPVLSMEQREFGRKWLTYGLGHVADLGLESQAGEIQKALKRVASFPWETRE